MYKLLKVVYQKRYKKIVLVGWAKEFRSLLFFGSIKATTKYPYEHPKNIILQFKKINPPLSYIFDFCSKHLCSFFECVIVIHLRV